MQQKLNLQNIVTPTTQQQWSNTGNTKSFKPTLEHIDLTKKIPLKISDNVLNQSRFLCRNISEVEWSGILFFSTTGEFGKDDFEITTEYIFPMNKGTKTYTEFETTPDYIDFIMNNPQALQWQRGLVHL